MAGSVVAGSVVQERIENEWFLAALGGGRSRIHSVGRIEHARFARGSPLRLGIGLLGSGRLRRGGVRRQVEPAFAPAAAKREYRRAEQDDGPSRRCRTVSTIHGKIPNAAAPYKDCPVLARPRPT